MPQVSLFRLYTLRICYFILAAGLGVYIWPTVVHHTSELAVTAGIRFALLAGLGATATLGLRYPVQMVPLLLFEMIWKTIYLIAFALPLWSAGQINEAVAEDIKAVLIGCNFHPSYPVAPRVRAIRRKARRTLEMSDYFRTDLTCELVGHVSLNA